MPSVGFGAFGKKINTATEPLPNFPLQLLDIQKYHTAGPLSQTQLPKTKYIVFGFNMEFG